MFPLQPNNPFYYLDLLDIANNDRNPSSQRNRIRTLMQGLNNVKPFWRQENEVLVMWLSSLRMRREDQDLPPLWSIMIEEGFCENLIRLVSHSYRTNSRAPREPDVDFWDNRRAKDDQDGDYSFYPTYAAEILAIMVHSASPYLLQKIYDRLFGLEWKWKSARIMSKTLKYGLLTTRYQIAMLITKLSMRTPFATDVVMHEAENGGMIDALLTCLELPIDAFKKELESDEGTHQVDIVKRMQSTKDAIRYAPRYMHYVFEAASQAILTAQNFGRPKHVAKLHYLKLDNLVKRLVALSQELPKTYYPSCSKQADFASTLATLCHIDVGVDVTDTTQDAVWKQELRLFDQSDNVQKVIDALHSIRSIPDVFTWASKSCSQTHKYLPEQPLGQQDVMEAVQTVFDAEVAFLDILCSLSEVKEIAQKIYDHRNHYVEQVINDFLFNKISHDDYLHQITEGDEHVQLCKSNTPWKAIGGLQSDAIHYSPIFEGCVILLWKNLHKHNTGIRFNAQRFTSLLIKVVRTMNAAAIPMVKEREWADALYQYSVCIRMLSGYEQADEEIAAILYSNRSEMYLQLKNYEAAADNARSALLIDPSHDKSKTRLNRAEMAISKSGQ